MKLHYIILGVAVVIIILLAGNAVSQNGQLSELQKKAELDKAQIDQLRTENQKLKETADYYYQQGVDLESAGNLDDAKAAFEAVVDKFPTNHLTSSARQRLAVVNNAIAKAEADRAAELQRQQEEQEKLNREEGEPIEYGLLYAKALSMGLPIGKRFRFSAEIDHELTLAEVDYAHSPSLNKELTATDAAFDDETQYERFLQGPKYQIHTIVASMGADGHIKIHRIE